MCLTYPAKILKIKNKKALIKTKNGKRDINIGALERLKVGDYVLFNADLAVEKVSRQEAKEIMEIFDKT